MNKKEQYKHLVTYTANLITVLFETVGFAWLWFNVYKELMKVPFFAKGHWAMICLYMLMVFFFTNILGGYNIGYLQAADICLSQVLAVVMTNFVYYFVIVLACRKYVTVRPLILFSLVEIAFAVVWVMFVRRLYTRLYPPRQTIVVYGNYAPDDIIEKINTRRDRYNICASVSYTVGYQKLYPLLKEYNAVILFDLPPDARNQIVKYCYQESIRTYVTPKISDVLVRGAEDIHLFDTPLLLVRAHGLSIDQRFVKRFFDIALSLFGILLLSPIMILIAAGIKLYDRGPVFYTQDRLTRDGREFEIIKFRSMSLNSEQGGAQLAKKDDDRITPVGRLIRRAHLDELPQLFNILKGDMSLVGPRPERKVIADRYTEYIPEFGFRLKVKAGLTGYAQVYGKYNTTPYDKVKLDITYIENYSLWLDFKLLLLTVKVIFQKENTEGIEQDQITAIKREKEKTS